MTIDKTIRIGSRLPDGFRIRASRVDLVPARADFDNFDRARLGELLQASVPESWPPATVPGSDAEDSAGWWEWYAVKRETAELIGVIALKGWPAVNGEVQVGCAFVREFQRQGYGTEAVEAMTRWALEQPSIRKVVAEIPVGHTGSETVLRRLGFEAARRDDEFEIHFKT